MNMYFIIGAIVLLVVGCILTTIYAKYQQDNDDRQSKAALGIGITMMIVSLITLGVIFYKLDHCEDNTARLAQLEKINPLNYKLVPK